MGFWKTLFDVVDVVSDPVSALNDRTFKVTCSTLEIFEIGTQWEGTARVRGAGEHIRTEKVYYSTSITLPYRDDDSRYTRRGLLRKQLRDWLGSELSTDSKITKESVVLNSHENCLSFQGYIKKVGSKWMLVDDVNDARYYGSYKLFLTDSHDDSKVGHEELSYLFMEETQGYVTRVDVKDGF